MKGDNDIKAPDGYLLGGLRRVRKDGTILFQRGYWQAPVSGAGQEVWVHEYYAPTDMRCSSQMVKAWTPGVNIWNDEGGFHICDRTDRKDAKPGYRDPTHIAWHNRNKSV